MVMGINYLAVVAAVIVAFVASTLWYTVFGAERERLLGTQRDASERPPVWMMLVELLRSFVLAYVLAVLFGLAGTAGFFGVVGLGLLMWSDFPSCFSRVPFYGTECHSSLPPSIPVTGS